MIKRLIALLVCFTFIISNLPYAYAQVGPGEGFNINQLPVPGTLVGTSSAYVPMMVAGLSMHPENPLLMDFLVSTGNSGLDARQVKEQSGRLIKYFLASLTIPEDDQWVNLSPYEKERIIPKDLGQTVLGQDMMAQDYLLKQLMASLIYPERNLGRNFWDKVYARASELYGTTQIPINTFNKVWILPDTATVYEHKDTVFVVKSHLKVMLEEDYLSLRKHAPILAGQESVIARSEATKVLMPDTRSSSQSLVEVNTLGSQVIRQVILPAIEHEVNLGQNFAQLRQIYNSMILAVWFKNNLKEALLNQVYSDRAKINGVNVNDPAVREKIYQQYLRAYKKGVFNYIKEDVDPKTQEIIPRKYFSGGLVAPSLAMIHTESPEQASRDISDLFKEPVYDVKGIGQGITGLYQGLNPTASPAMIVNLNGLLAQSNALVDRIQAANNSKNIGDLDVALEEARVQLDESKPKDYHNHPYLFAIRSPESTKAADITTLTISQIKRRINRYLNFKLSTEDAQSLQQKTSLSLEDVSKNDTVGGRLANEARSQQVALIEEAALKAGLLGTRYYVTNIKRFSQNSFLPYMDYLRGLADEFNGHAVFLLSVEESDKVLGGDMAGEATAIAAIRKVLGDEFLDKADIDIITDGGLKTRAGASTALNGYNGLFPTAYGMPYYRRAMQLLAKVRMQQPEYGKGKVFWTASDGDYQVGNIQYGTNFGSDNWSFAIHGVAEKIVPDSDKEELFKEMQEAGDLNNIQGRLDQFPTIAKALGVIRDKKLTELGEILSQPGTGRLAAFVEKPTAEMILRMLTVFHTNSIIPNVFLVVYNRQAFKRQQDAFEKVDEKTGKALREYGGSYFDFVVGNQFQGSIGYTGLTKDEQRQMDTLKDVLPSDTMIAANLGGIGAFTDRGKSEFLVNAYYEEVGASKRRGESGLIKRGVVTLGKNVTLKLAPGATAILDNVIIESEGDQPVVVNLSDNTFFQNTILRLSNDVHFGQETVMVNAKINGKIEVQPDNHNIVVEGVIFNPDVQDFTQDGKWENPGSLQLFSGETVVSILKLDGTRYLNRAPTKANYKSWPLTDIFGGENKLEEARASHPRLGLNLPSVTKAEWITHVNWQGEGTQNVDITAAKPFIDYVKMSQAIKEITKEIRGSQASPAMQAVGNVTTSELVDGLFFWKTTEAPHSEGITVAVFRKGKGGDEQVFTDTDHFIKKSIKVLKGPDGRYYLNYITLEEGVDGKTHGVKHSKDITDMAALATPGGIDLNAAHLNMQSQGEKVNITFDPAMIEEFKRGDFSGVKIQILDVVPVNLMALLGINR
jgi:hypothetical protein